MSFSEYTDKSVEDIFEELKTSAFGISDKEAVLVQKKYTDKIMKKKAKKESGSGEDSEYWRIKKEYRRLAN